jgi:hypothetical protein
MAAFPAFNPSDNHHSAAQKPNSDLTTFAISNAVVNESEMPTGKNVGGLQKINATLCQGSIALKRVISDFHGNYCSYSKPVLQCLLTSGGNLGYASARCASLYPSHVGYAVRTIKYRAYT